MDVEMGGCVKRAREAHDKYFNMGTRTATGVAMIRASRESRMNPRSARACWT